MPCRACRSSKGPSASAAGENKIRPKGGARPRHGIGRRCRPKPWACWHRFERGSTKLDSKAFGSFDGGIKKRVWRRNGACPNLSDRTESYALTGSRHFDPSFFGLFTHNPTG
jgi:hypothetical protein